MSDEQHMALPQLYGGPAYSRPPRPAQEIVRPFDPDELPLEAHRTDGEAAAAVELTGTTWAPVSAPPAKVRKARRNRAAKPAAGGKPTAGSVPAAGSAPAATPGGSEAGLQGRPFSLRAIGRILGGGRK